MRWALGLLVIAACNKPAATPQSPNEIARLAGVWDSDPSIGYWGLVISSDGTVEWISSGSEGKEEGKSRGVFRDGKLFLDPPMQRYQGPKESVLHYRIERAREYLFMDISFEMLAEDVEHRTPPPPDLYYGARRRLSQEDLENFILDEETERGSYQLFEEWLSSPVTKKSIAMLERWAKDAGDEMPGKMARQCLTAMITNDTVQDLSEELQKEAAEAMDRVLIESEE